MLFYSPHANFQVICTKTRQIRHPVSGDVIDTVPGIWANFGTLGPSYSFTNPETGEEMQGAQITGHFFDTDLEAVQKGWDPEIKAIVETKLLRLCQTMPDRIQQRQREVAKAVLPWPTYDSLDADEIVKLAPVLGKVPEVLAYEAENRARPHILDSLREPATVEEDDVAAPVVEPEPSRTGEKPGEPLLRTISV